MFRCSSPVYLVCFALIASVQIVGCSKPADKSSPLAPAKSTSSPVQKMVFGKPIIDEFSVKVTAVDDGDTIVAVGDDGTELTVRLECVDAPEGDEPFSDLARKGLSDLVLDKQVQLQVTGKDGRERTLAFVKLGDIYVGSYLIENGFARHFKRYSDDAELTRLEQSAIDKKLNIWSTTDAVDSSEPSGPDEPRRPNALTPPPHGLNILAWNVESDGSDIAVIAKQLRQLAGYSIYALSEVDKTAFENYRQALGEKFKSIEGTHKHNDFLQILYDDSQLELIDSDEIDSVAGVAMNRPDRAMRSPLWAKFKQRDSGDEFQIVLNHLARGDADFRTQQAVGLREWARNQTLPTICIGDFNFDYVFETKQGNEAFVEFMRDNVWQWIEPSMPIDSNWYDKESDGQDDYPDSILDFAFVAGAAKDMKWQCEVLVRNGDFPDNAQTSDHRPIVLEWQGE